MKELPVSRIQIEGIGLIVVFDASFDSMTETEREAALAEIRSQAKAQANLAVVWQTPSGKTKFHAPPHLHAFLQIASYSQLAAQINDALKRSA